MVSKLKPPAEAAARIVEVLGRVPPHRAALVAVSGIDGAGKDYLTKQIESDLVGSGVRVALVNVDGWLNPPHVRFADADPAAHFLRHAIRFEEMFASLVLPLRDARSIDIEAHLIEETAAAPSPETGGLCRCRRHAAGGHLSIY